MAPPLKRKKKEGQRGKNKKSTTIVNAAAAAAAAAAAGGGAAMYDAELDADDPTAQKNAGPKPGTVLGIAISWAPGAAAYIPFYGTSVGGTWTAAAQKIADVIVASDVEIAWFGWKDQVEATRWLLSHASKQKKGAADCAADCGSGGTSASAHLSSDATPEKKNVLTRTGADLHHFMTDARIAMWMCQPDSSTVHDGILTDDDLHSSLLSSDGKRKHADEKRIHGAEVLLKSLVKSVSGDCDPDTYVSNVVQGLNKDDKSKPMGSQALHACQTAAVALQLRNVSMKFLTSQNDPALFDALRRYEMPLVPVLADMERAGAGFSIEKLNKMSPRMKRRLTELHTLAHQAAGPGPEFSMTSPTDIRDVIYSRLQLPPPHGAEREGTSKKDGSKYITYSTGRQFLLMLRDAHPIVPMIIEHRKLTHTVGRVRDMIELAKAERALLQQFEKGDGGRMKIEKMQNVVAVHCPFIHTGTATGRLAMEGFNLQNLTKPYAFKALPSQPKGGGVAGGGSKAVENNNTITENTESLDDGSMNLTQEGVHMHLEANLRSAIVPSKPGRVILGADFRQIEFRLMAHFSKDPVVKEMLQDGAEDPFKLVAARWKKVPVDRVTSKSRDDAKQIVYALFYGMGAGAMADKLEVSPKRAQQMKDEFLNTYSGIKSWIEQVKIECTETGYIKTLAGRRRWIPSIKSEDWQARASGERKAVNSICQGSAADVAKKAMIDICREFEMYNLRTHVDMVLQIHDEFVFEVDLEYQEKVAKIVKQCMENAAVLEVPLRAKLEIGASWGEMSRLNFEI
jgi:DNA polymerase I-like protein with 3'-5' exonuclease and polymerase domains